MKLSRQFEDKFHFTEKKRYGREERKGERNWKII